VTRSSAAAPRTTRCCWARRAWARPRSSRAWRSGSSQRGPRDPLREAAGRARPGDDGRGHQVPRPVRGAHQGGHERGPPAEERHPVHRRAAHARRRGRRRGRDRREQRAQAGARRGEIQCIGATTFDEYRKYIEKDARSRVASRRSPSTRPARSRRSRSSRACATSTRRTTACGSPTRRSRRRSSSRAATSRAGCSPTSRST
jgi:hypothetical protein